ncbi:fungal-specific transcription factor domain-containing protein [Aspergillus pseudotamarii]|uniref:Fungal-specific transcription factor domain-containing protein n=1 Tax=Aspergillus pseudotamarii TaxID=132259 RepID=A0A5N6T1Q7_ASPPS|nr:fungal-specific transcription factor domain-containing protein [Aspergillus pseudotamarii]KAE8140227.1 fungal-specific transcription factor domain-containing protein [Aspergillus pseudotamarii]
MDDILTLPETGNLLSYFDTTLCSALIIDTDDLRNPFRGYILPLAYRDIGILNAVLGLTMCHIISSGKRAIENVSVARMIEHQLSALQSLSSLLMKEEMYGLTDDEQDILLAVVILLVLYDICETGVSSHGVHLTGAGYICGKLAQQPKVITSPRTTFLLTALTWLDVLRAFSGAEKLAYSDNVRRCILEAEHFNLETLVGCPVELFYEIGCILTAGKQYMDGELSHDDFQNLLDDAEQFFRAWDPESAAFPSEDLEWIQLAEAYRHVCIIRVLRFPDTWAIPCEDHRIQSSVCAILDASAEISADSSWFKRLLFPLFIASAETSIPHQKRYIEFCMREIKKSTGFPHPAMNELLSRVWGERQQQANKSGNVPWMEFTCSKDLVRQHDYLMF